MFKFELSFFVPLLMLFLTRAFANCIEIIIIVDCWITDHKYNLHTEKELFIYLFRLAPHKT